MAPGPASGVRKLHHKLIVVGDSVVIAGSFDYTAPANDYNDEILFVLGSPHDEADGHPVNHTPLSRAGRALLHRDRMHHLQQRTTRSHRLLCGGLGGQALPEAHDDVEARLLSDIAAVGWHVVRVRAPPSEVFDETTEHWAGMSAASLAAYRADFAYTVGMCHRYDHPEIVVVGDWQYAREVLNSAAEFIAGGTRFGAGDRSGEVIEGLDVRFAAMVDQAHD